ncbi:glycosyltransferase [Nocardioides marmoribigeumensis]|uniref:Glycosyltransferase subfamily 4-like N-terminal domain-containing protein n=1 Tax=Nocardioides marmoribigeumensis TaxID=433649 RepID=A0ABU2BZV9_9ACTN|nr:glycosyltransferase [Nocardioides marmoribigeumensis]MDR7363943.1 hypothetical protein [Nocardioides marmoribigeumensis]
MRIVIVSETFWPRTSSTSMSVRQVLDGLVDTSARAGHEPVLVTPGGGASDYRGVPVVRTRSVPTRTFPVGLPDPQVEQVLARVRPDAVHLASPWLLGASALRAARARGIPVVAELRWRGTPGCRRPLAAGLPLDRWWRRIHRDVHLTPVPTSRPHGRRAPSAPPRSARGGTAPTSTCSARTTATPTCTPAGPGTAYTRVAQRPWSVAVEELVMTWAEVASARLPLAG